MYTMSRATVAFIEVLLVGSIMYLKSGYNDM